MNNVTTNFKRSFRGYDSVSVVRELSLIEQEFVQKREVLRRELANQVQQKENLKNEVERLENELQPTISMQDDLTQRLVTAHFKATERIILTITDMEAKELDLANKIDERKKELNRLHSVTNKMSREFLDTATRYGTMLSWGKEGEVNVKD